MHPSPASRNIPAASRHPNLATIAEFFNDLLGLGEDPLKIGGLTPARIAFAVKLARVEGWPVDASSANAPCFGRDL